MNDQSSQLRRDPHHGGWVLNAHQPEREQLLNIPRSEWPQQSIDALFSNSNGVHVVLNITGTLPDGRQNTVRAIANRYALYRVEGMEEREGRGMYDLMRGVGAHEVIVESERREDTLSKVCPHQYALVLQAFQERILDLRKDQRLRSFSVFREWDCSNNNHYGVHPHSQLVASAIIPLGQKTELDASREYFNYKERCLFCDMIRQEQADETRVISNTDEFISFCPFASRYPFEVHLFSKRHSYDFCDEPRDRLPLLAAMIGDTVNRLERALPGWRIVMLLHTRPVFDPRKVYYHTIAQDYHWHFEFLPMPPGFIDWYARTGAHVECTPPETAAQYLRELDVPDPWSG